PAPCGGGGGAGPGRLKVETADAPVDVEDLADQEQSRTDARLHRRGIDLGEINAACRHFREVVAARVDDGQRPRRQRRRDAPSVAARGMRLLSTRVISASGRSGASSSTFSTASATASGRSAAIVLRTVARG